MIMRPMEYTDLPAVVDMFDEVMAHDLELGSTLIEPDKDTRKKGIFKALTQGFDTGLTICLVGDVDGKIGGFVFAAIFQQFEFCRHKKTVYVFAAKTDSTLPIGTRAAIVRRGSQYLKQWAFERGATSFWGNVLHTNEKSRKMMRTLQSKAEYIRYEGAI